MIKVWPSVNNVLKQNFNKYFSTEGRSENEYEFPEDSNQDQDDQVEDEPVGDEDEDEVVDLDSGVAILGS